VARESRARESLQNQALWEATTIIRQRHSS
jgi:hypothetical protein